MSQRRPVHVIIDPVAVAASLFACERLIELAHGESLHVYIPFGKREYRVVLGAVQLSWANEDGGTPVPQQVVQDGESFEVESSKGGMSVLFDKRENT